MANDLLTTCAVKVSAPDDEQDRLVQILDQYLVTLERGDPIALDVLLAQHPDVADRLRGYLSGLQIFHDAVGDLPRRSLGLSGGSSDPELRGELGDFRLVREIGRGGMGVVYEAIQVSLRRRVAIKVLPFAAAIDDKQITRFKNEAQAAAQVDHPNIVPVFAIGEEQGVHYFAMQLIGGQSLSQLLDRLLGYATDGVPTPVSGRETIRIENVRDHVQNVARMGIQAAEALHAAHEIGVVHRDVKPSNLLLDEKGKLWVTDFGIARCRTSENLTSTGHAIGTMRYMSPEQAQGKTALVDHRTDIYSLGVTLYELACLRHPFEGVADAVLAFEFGRSGLRRPSYWNSSIPADFENIVLKAMAEGRDERYATAQELAEDLGRFLEGKPILARRPTLTSRLCKWARWHKRSVAAAAGVLAFAMLGGVASLIVISAERMEKDKAYQVATANHERAEARFRQAQEMLDHFGSRVAQRLASVPGAEGMRKQLLSEMLPYYREFAQESADDPALQADLALTYSKIGYLADQLDSLSEAERAYADSQAILERLVESQPENREHVRSLALCCNNLGQLLQKRGEMKSAREQLDRALVLQQRLAASAPLSTDYRADLATTHSNLGLLLSRTGDKQQAAERYRAAIQLLESIFKTAPQDTVNLNNLAATYNNLSALFSGVDEKAARRWVEKAMSVQLSLVRDHPKQREYQSDLALSYNNLGAILSRESQWLDAEKCYLDAITIQKRLVASAPLVTTYRRDLSVSYNNLGMTQGKAGAVSEAEASFASALTIQKELVAARPHDLNLLSGLAGIYNNLGMVYQSKQAWPEASEAFKRAIASQKQTFDQASQVAYFRESLSKHYYNYACALRKLHRPAEAAAATVARRKLWPGDATRLVRIAQELAAICKEMNPGTTRKQYVEETLITLRAAKEAGLQKATDLKMNPFDVLPDDAVTAVLEAGRLPDRASAQTSEGPTVQ